MKFYRLYFMDMFGNIKDEGTYALLLNATIDGEKWKRRAKGNSFEVLPFEEEKI